MEDPKDDLTDFAELNAQMIAEWPAWKRQYDLRVSQYGPEPLDADADVEE